MDTNETETLEMFLHFDDRTCGAQQFSGRWREDTEASPPVRVPMRLAALLPITWNSTLTKLGQEEEEEEGPSAPQRDEQCCERKKDTEEAESQSPAWPPRAGPSLPTTREEAAEIERPQIGQRRRREEARENLP